LEGPKTLIQLCGPLVVEIDGVRIERRLPGRQGELLFAFLVLNRGARVGRDQMIEAVWPRGGPGAADSGLSALLSKLRSALEPVEIEGRPEVQLRLPESAQIDVETAMASIHRAESAVAQARWEAGWAPARIALHICNREFLPGADAPWVDERRRELEDVQLRALECVAAIGLAMGDAELAAAERSGRRLVKLAPLRESGYLRLIEALERRRSIAEALQVYERLCQVLRDEMGIAPGEQARAAHSRLIERRG
jgi:DNA-binding SARP family transcriptional activator